MSLPVYPTLPFRMCRFHSYLRAFAHTMTPLGVLHSVHLGSSSLDQVLPLLSLVIPNTTYPALYLGLLFFLYSYFPNISL